MPNQPTAAERLARLRGETDLRERRLALGLTQLDVALAAGISNAMLRNLEAGYRPKRGRTLAAVESVLADPTMCSERRVVERVEVRGRRLTRRELDLVARGLWALLEGDENVDAKQVRALLNTLGF